MNLEIHHSLADSHYISFSLYILNQYARLIVLPSVVCCIVVPACLFGIVGEDSWAIPLHRIAKWYCYIAVFAVVVVMDSIFFPFIGGKDWFFRFAVELSLISFLLVVGVRSKSREVKKLIEGLFKKPIVIAVSVFALTLPLVVPFAMTPTRRSGQTMSAAKAVPDAPLLCFLLLLIGFLLRNEG